MTATLPDRRAALKARHRSAILAAANALVVERGGPAFSVDDLAERADVARRTVFNHFSSLDDVLLTACSEALDVLADNFLASVEGTPQGDGSRSAMLDELVIAVHGSDLPAAITTMVRILGGPDAADSRRADLTSAAFARVSTRLVSELVRRHSAADPLDVELLVGSLVAGLATIARHWAERTGARIDDASRAEWDRLLARLLRSLRSGYMPV